jgi:hypothetical protein
MSEGTTPRRAVGLVLLGGLLGAGPVAGQAPPLSTRIAAAVVPLPASLRPGAGVVVLTPSGEPNTLRFTTNGMICISDPPGDAWFDVECYHSGFIQIVYRMKELKAAGLSEADMDRKIEAEIRLGTLKLTPRPTMNYQLFGPISGYDSTTNTVSNAIQATQRLFIPWSTPASSGVPEEEDIAHPWIMAPGTYYAHVMIVPAARLSPQPLPQ